VDLVEEEVPEPVPEEAWALDSEEALHPGLTWEEAEEACRDAVTMLGIVRRQAL